MLQLSQVTVCDNCDSQLSQNAANNLKGRCNAIKVYTCLGSELPAL